MRIAATMMLALVASTAASQGAIPTVDLKEELRIVSQEAVPNMQLTPVSSGTVLPDGRLVLMHSNESVMRVFDASGKLLSVVGRRGQGPGEFGLPLSVGFVGDTVWVRDIERNAYQLFTASFQPIGSIAMPSRGGFFHGVAVGSTSFFYTSITDTSRIGLYDREGKLVRPLSIAMRSAAHRFEVRDPDRARLLAGAGVAPPPGTSPNIRMMSSPLSVQTRVDLVPGGREVLVCESNELWGGRPGQFMLRHVNAATGQVSPGVEVSLPARRVTPAEGDSLIALATRTSPQVADEYRSKAKIPTYYPAVRSLMSGADGSVWIGEYASPGTQLVLDASGTMLFRVRLPPNLQVLVVTRTHVWGVLRDADDLPIILRYRVQS